MKILIVDDSKTMRMIIKKTMKAAGYGQHDVVEASNGMDALNVLKAESVDLILSDWNMPTLNGIRLLEKLNEQSSSIPFGFITSEGTEEMVSQATAAGAKFYITKPFTPEKFKEEISKVM